MAHNTGQTVLMGKTNRLKRFGQRANLIDLDQNAVRRFLFDAALQPHRIGDKQIIPDQLYIRAYFRGQRGPTSPIFLSHAVLDRLDRIGRCQIS